MKFQRQKTIVIDDLHQFVWIIVLERERERDRDKKNGELQYLASYGNYFSILNILANQNQVRKLIPFQRLYQFG